jgi:hypothetical protein
MDIHMPMCFRLPLCTHTRPMTNCHNYFAALITFEKENRLLAVTLIFSKSAWNSSPLKGSPGIDNRCESRNHDIRDLVTARSESRFKTHQFLFFSTLKFRLGNKPLCHPFNWPFSSSGFASRSSQPSSSPSQQGYPSLRTAST